MNSISIPKFLDLIDPGQEINRKQAFLDLSLVAFYAIFRQASNLLGDTAKQEVLTLLSDTENLRFRNIYSIFESNQKSSELNAIATDTSRELQNDYVKTQFKALDPDYQKELLNKYPELIGIGD